MNLPSLHLIVLFRFLGRCFRLTGFTGRMFSLLGLLIQILIFFSRNMFMDLGTVSSQLSGYTLAPLISRPLENQAVRFEKCIVKCKPMESMAGGS